MPNWQWVDLWWWIFCVNFNGLRDAQIVNKILFLDVSVRVSLEKIGITQSSVPKQNKKPTKEHILFLSLLGLRYSFIFWSQTFILLLHRRLNPNQNLHHPSSISLVLFLWRTLTNTHISHLLFLFSFHVLHYFTILIL